MWFSNQPKRAFLLLMAFSLFPVAIQAQTISPERQANLKHLLIQDCGSCHGLRMKGGLGTPLTPEALAGKPKKFLAGTIIHGRPGTAMPPWSAILNQQEADWLVEQLLQGVSP